MPVHAPVRPRNDPAQYDDLADVWWDRRGRLAMLHWIAASRAALIPVPVRPGALLVDVGCGGGLLAPHVGRLGYRHLGIDLSVPALRRAAEHGVSPVRADAARLPLAAASADVVVAGELLEHVPDLPPVLAELARVLRPGGTLVLDTIAATRYARLISITLGERIPGGPPPRLHDPRLFVDRDRLRADCARLGIPLRLTGLRLSVRGYLGWLAGRPGAGRMTPARSTAGLFQGVGVKTGPAAPEESP